MYYKKAALTSPVNFLPALILLWVMEAYYIPGLIENGHQETQGKLLT